MTLQIAAVQLGRSLLEIDVHVDIHDSNVAAGIYLFVAWVNSNAVCRITHVATEYVVLQSVIMTVLNFVSSATATPQQLASYLNTRISCIKIGDFN